MTDSYTIEDPDRKLVFERLREALDLLAQPPEAQLRYLRSEGTPNDDNDEIVFGFEAFAPAVLERDDVSPGLDRALRELDAQLDSMSGRENAQLWEDSAIRSAPEWEKVRRLGRAALRELPE